MTYDEVNTDRDLIDWIAQGIRDLEESLEHHAEFALYLLATHKEEPQWTSST